MSSLKYFEVSYSIDRDVVGTIPQINTIKGANHNDVDFYQSLSDITKFPSSIPRLNDLILDEDAQLTDFINITFLSSSHSLLISPKFKLLLDKYVSPFSKYYDTVITNGIKKFPYHLLLFLKAFDLVEYSKSEFIITGFDFHDVKRKVHFNSLDEYNADENDAIDEITLANKIALKESVDLFNLPHNGIFFSEKLKNKIEEEGLTGMVFTESKIEFTLA